MRSKTIHSIALSILAGTSLLMAGCSVGMALSSKPDPDMSVVKIGADRATIEKELGKPAQTTVLDNGGTHALYKCTFGDTPSVSRALAHGAKDLLTWGLWEIIATPVEMGMGTTTSIYVSYNASDQATEINNCNLL
ncbi:MAG TPA: hypothetical protein PLV25_08020 [Opitutales bacterium]|nr:hypothetical protein [Opitutales bacterium]